MAALKDKVQNALDEARMLMLGTQVLIGFDFQAVLQRSFDELPRVTQQVKLGSLSLMALTLGLLLWPGSYHQIAERGEDSQRMHDFTSRVMAVALLPFGLGLSLEIYAAFEKVLGQAVGLTAGVIGSAVVLFFWYVLGAVKRQTRSGGQQLSPNDRGAQPMPTPLTDRIRQVLTEARVVLPGAQALLGFQLVAVLADGFDKLPAFSRAVHLASLALVALSTALLMTPAAYHRIVERGEDSEHFYRVAGRLVLAAMVPLGLGLCGDFYVVVEKVARSEALAIGAAGLLLAFFFGLWFGYTWLSRVRGRGSSALQGEGGGHATDAIARVD